MPVAITFGKKIAAGNFRIVHGTYVATGGSTTVDIETGISNVINGWANSSAGTTAVRVEPGVPSSKKIRLTFSADDSGNFTAIG